MLFPCKFQPAFNTSPTVAALLLLSVAGLVALVVGAVVPVFAPSRLPATLVIGLPPLFKPSFVKDTGFFAGASFGVIVMPLPLITVVSPAAFVKVALVKPVNSGFKE